MIDYSDIIKREKNDLRNEKTESNRRTITNCNKKGHKD